jgi:hypothetical protein
MAAATFVVSLFGTCLTLIGIFVAICAFRTWRNTLENQRADVNVYGQAWTSIIENRAHARVPPA